MDDHIAVRKQNRDWENWFYRMIYVFIFRSTYVVIWFYFLPIFMMILQFMFSNQAITTVATSSDVVLI